MANEFGTDNTVDKPKKKRTQGPRKPQPIYVFITKNDEGKTTVSKSFRNPRAMAEYIPTSMQNGEELLVLTPE